MIILSIVKDGKVIFSYSSFSQFKKCPYAFFLAKIKRLQTSYDKTYTVPGLILHGAAESLINNKDEFQFTDEGLNKQLDFYISDPDVHINEIYGSREALFSKLKAGSNFLQQFIKLNSINSLKLYSELTFGDYYGEPLTLTPKVEIQGSIDLVAQKENNNVIIYDYKYTFSLKNLDLDQLLLYSLAVKKLLNLDARMAGYFLIPLNREQYFTFNEFDKQSFISRINAAADKVLNHQFNPTDNPKNCQFCQFKEVCDKKPVLIEQPTQRTVKPEISNFSF